MNGLGLMGADSQSGTTSTFLSGVPIAFGNATTPGSGLGENLHHLIVSELPPVTPAGSITNGAISLGSITALFSGSQIPQTGGILSPGSVTPSVSQAASTFTGTPFGGNGSHNTVERSTIVYWELKL